MTIGSADLGETRRLAEEANIRPRFTVSGQPAFEYAAFIAHCNPAFVLEFVREVERLRELLDEWLLLGDLPGGGYGGTLEARTRAALANPAAEAMPKDKGCPLCGAPPGAFCHTPAGTPRSDHRAREYANAEAGE